MDVKYKLIHILKKLPQAQDIKGSTTISFMGQQKKKQQKKNNKKQRNAVTPIFTESTHKRSLKLL